MSISITKTDGSPLNFSDLANGVATAIRLTNDATPRTVKLFLVCMDDKGSEASLPEGKEICEESWVYAKVSTDSAWTQIGLPTFPDLFSDAFNKALAISLGALEVIEVNIKIVHPDDAETGGIANFMIKGLAA